MDRKMLQRRCSLLLLAAGIVLAACGCSQKQEDRVKLIQEAGVFKVAIVDTDSQFTSLEGGTPVGVEPELMETIADALGVSVQYQVVSRTEALDAVAGGLADAAVGCINDSGVLSEEYGVSTPYGKGFFYAVTKRGDFAMTIGAFADSVVGVGVGLDEGTRAQLYQASGVTVNEYSQLQAAAADIKEGRIRAYICYENQAEELSNDPELQVQNIMNLEPEEFVIVTGKADQTLTNGIDTLIRQFLEKE